MVFEKEEVKHRLLDNLKKKSVDISSFIWNKRTHQLLGRTFSSWVKILAFYISFYAVLAGFFAVCFVVFLRTLDDRVPTMQNMFSMLKNNPGVGLIPQAQDDSTLVYFNADQSPSYTGESCVFGGHSCNYTGLLSDELAMYTDEFNSKLKLCSVGDGATGDLACKFPISLLGSNCTEENHFGYREGKPCILLKINKVFGWNPAGSTFPYTSCAEFGQWDSNSCRLHNISDRLKSDVASGHIPVSCEGENPGDNDNINKVTFHPSAGFPAYYFPYFNQPGGFLSPLVMAQFDIKPGRVVMIWCKIWTPNIKHDLYDLQGSIHFEMLLDFPSANNVTNGFSTSSSVQVRSSDVSTQSIPATSTIASSPSSVSTSHTRLSTSSDPASPSTGTSSDPASSSTGTSSDPASSSTGTSSDPASPSTGTSSESASPSTGTSSDPASPSTGTSSDPASSSTGTLSDPASPSTGTSSDPASPSTGASSNSEFSVTSTRASTTATTHLASSPPSTSP